MSHSLQYCFILQTLLHFRFDEFGISPLTVKALSDSGYVYATVVQEASLSIGLEGIISFFL